eukprot:12930988-Prorocentrum_lima.AAC.1
MPIESFLNFGGYSGERPKIHRNPTKQIKWHATSFTDTQHHATACTYNSTTFASEQVDVQRAGG